MMSRVSRPFMSSVPAIQQHHHRLLRHRLLVIPSKALSLLQKGNSAVVHRGTHLAGFSCSTFRSRRWMTTAYSGEPGDGKLDMENLSFIPDRTTILNGRKVEVGPFKESEWLRGMELMNLIIQEGKSWPFEEEFPTVDTYRGYFLSHTAFVVRSLEEGVDNEGGTSPVGDVLGCFYVKPNYPGRCSHICNGGFITAPNFRRMGVAKLMGKTFLRAARGLGYKSAYFNLVFKSNAASVALWESLGFERVAMLENAARLQGVDGLDTAYGYRYDLETLSDDDCCMI